MRRTAISMAVVGAMAALPAPALAIQSVQKASATVSPSTAGTKASPRAVTLTVRAYFDSIAPDLDRAVQFATANGRVYLPREGITNNRLFRSCSVATVFRDEALCPSGSRIGTGTARGIGIGLDESLTLQAFNLSGGRGMAVLVVGESPLIIREVVVATQKTLTSDPKYRYRISFTLPKNLQTPAPGIIAAMKDFRLKVPAQYLKKNGAFVKRDGRKVPYIATTGCAKGRWYGKYVAEYTTSFDSTIESSQAVNVSVPCRRAAR